MSGLIASGPPTTATLVASASLLAATTFACVPPSSNAGPPPEEGRYGVTGAGGVAIPAALPPGAGLAHVGGADCRRFLTGGALELLPGGEYSMTLSVHDQCPGQSSASVRRSGGTYTLTGDHIHFAPADGPDPFQGTHGGSEIVVPVLGASLAFRLGETGAMQSDLSTYLRREYEAEASRRTEARRRANRAYACTADAILDRAPAVPAADTVGMGDAIDQHFPEWRLSTEREIACRFPLGDGSRPELYWGEAWGSGRAWWIWEGDFNGDGRADRLALLTSRASPSIDLLVVIFADGSAAEVGSIGGWGVMVGPPATTVVRGFDADEPPIRLVGDGITLMYWEKATTVFYWADGRFRSINTMD